VDKHTPMHREDAAIEAGLREAMARRPAPEGFADRLMARVAIEGAARHGVGLNRWRGEVTWYRAIAAGLVLAVAGTITGGYLQHEHQQQVAGDHARRQVMLALRITAVTLESVDSKMNNDDSKVNNNDSKSSGDPGSSKEEQP
jgi:hypothetical protein